MTFKFRGKEYVWLSGGRWVRRLYWGVTRPTPPSRPGPH